MFSPLRNSANVVSIKSTHFIIRPPPSAQKKKNLENLKNVRSFALWTLTDKQTQTKFENITWK